MLKIGLTGGIGCGKSVVSRLFAELGAPILDADDIARELVEPGQPALAEIVEIFGAGVMDGERLNRAALRDAVFRSATSRKRLEAILHPRVYERMEQRMSTLHHPYCVLAIPLLLETGRRSFVDRILVVDCRPERQSARVMARDGLDASAVAGIMATQVSREVRLAAADDLIENDGDLGSLANRIRELDRFYRAQARVDRF